MISLGIDVETYSSTPIDLGAYRYAESLDFELLLVGYKFSDEDEVKVIDLTAGEAELHPRFWAALTSPEVIKTAYNANFELQTLRKYTEQQLDPAQWRDTMILASSLGLPRSLADVCTALGLPEEESKKKIGKELIRYFCLPCKPTRANGNRTRNLPLHSPERWELFKDYNKGDVIAEQAILHRLEKYAPNETEQRLWTLDQQINDRGVLLDTDMAGKIVRYNERRTEELTAEAKRITRLDNPNSLQQLKGWLEDQGVPTSTLRKDDVSELLSAPIPEDVKRVLTIRQALGKTSLNKYSTMLDVACHDGRARGILQFYGGRTGRWAGRALQPQNLPQNHLPDAELFAAHDIVKAGDFDGLELLYDDTADVLSQLVRTAFIPSPGNRFVVTDFSAIEARVIAWLAGEQWRIDLFEKGGDIYCESASRIYKVPVEKHGQNAELRQRGKVAELACGFGGGPGAMKAMDKSGTVPEEEIAEIVRQWRDASPHIVAMWKTLEKAAIRAIEGESVTLNKIKGVKFYCERVAGTRVLFMRLPSGRSLAYWSPSTSDSDYGPQLYYMAQNQTTRKWEKTKTWGGTLAENLTQAVARDCLAEKMLLADSQGYNIVFHVHDELVIDVPKHDARAAELIDRIMSEPIEWAPGLPLKGGTYECEYYRKD